MVDHLASQDFQANLNQAAGIKPVLAPVVATSAPASDQVINGSYVDEGIRQLAHLSQSVGQTSATTEKLLKAFKFSCGEWAQNPVPLKLDKSGWVSDVSNDHSPLEYSLALDQRTGDAEVRFLVEAQPEHNSLAALQESVTRLSEDIATEYSGIASLDRLNTIRDVFMPQDAEGSLVAWHSFAMSKTLEKWKIYLNPHASGKANAAHLTREAMTRLGLESSWKLLESVMTGEDFVIYFALGMSHDPEEAEVKVYVAHPGASATDIAQKHTILDPSASKYQIEQFYSCMSGGSLGPFCGKPPISCIAFRSSKPLRPTRTVLFPMDSYAASDAEAQERVEAYMHAVSAPELYRERYRAGIDAVRRRPLTAGRGIHSWVSLKQKPEGKRSNTFYLSPELFGPLVDDGLLSSVSD